MQGSLGSVGGRGAIIKMVFRRLCSEWSGFIVSIFCLVPLVVASEVSLRNIRRHRNI
jgi:hypothetical protein